MKYSLVIRDKAFSELEDAYSWYEQQQKGLGELFLSEFKEYSKIIQSSPESFEKKYKDFRELLLKTFPYFIVYQIDKNTVVVFSVFHTSRNPKRKYKG